MKLRLCLFSLLFLMSQFVFCQQETIDSLRQRLKSANLSDTVKIDVLNRLGVVYLNSQPDSALVFANEAMNLSKDIGYQRGMAEANTSLGARIRDQGSLSGALEYLIKALDIYKNINDSLQVAHTYNGIGTIHGLNKNIEISMENFSTAQQYFERMGNNHGVLMVTNNIGNIYAFQGNDSMAHVYDLKALDMARESNDYKSEAISLHNIADYLVSTKGEHEQAIAYYKKALRVFKNMRISNKVQAYQKIGNAYYKIDHLEMAKNYLDTAYQLAHKHQLGLQLASTLDKLVRMKIKTHQNESALSYFEELLNLNDSLQRMENSSQLAEMQTKYETGKKEAQNQLLKLQNEQKEETISRQKMIVTTSIAVVVTILALSFLLYRAYTKKRKANAQLALQKQDLENLNATKDRFFGIIAHDLRGPISAFQGIAELIPYNIRKGNMENMEKLARQIEESFVRLNALLDNLLNWALSQSGALPFRPELLKLNNLVQECIDSFQDMADAKEITLKHKIPDDFELYADKDSMSTIVRNLVNNAIKFTNSGGAIEINANRENHAVNLEVKDNGVGMDQEKLRGLWKLDEKKKSSGTKNEKGTGLGLVLVKDFVQFNRGEIQVESEVGKGSKFIVSFPSD